MIKLRANFRYISSIFLAITFMPWSAIGLNQYELYIKELTVIFIFLFIVTLKLANNRLFPVDKSSKYYISFLFLCLVYYFIQANKAAGIQNITFLSHVLISTILNFVIFYIFLNIKINAKDIHYFVKYSFVLYFTVCVVFIAYSLSLHLLSIGMPGDGGIFTTEAQMEQQGAYIPYLGGMNGRSWFALILSSFYVGYFMHKGKIIYSYLCCFITLLASYLMVSRGAMIFGACLLATVIIKRINMRKMIFFSVFVLLASMLFIVYGSSEDLISFNLLVAKSGLSNRDLLFYEALDLSYNDYLIGRGFHSTTIDRPEFSIMGYLALPYIGTQNVFTSILIELGLIGVFLYSMFWFSLLFEINMLNKSSLDESSLGFLFGARYMTIWILLSFVFNHYSQKSFIAMPIYMIFLGIAASLLYYEKLCKRISM